MDAGLITAIVTAVGNIINTSQKTIAARYAGITNSNQSLQDYTANQELQFGQLYQQQLKAKQVTDIVLGVVLVLVVVFLLLYLLRK